MVHDRSGLLTAMASVGHRRAHMEQKIHALISISMCPRVPGYVSLFTNGYNRVAGLETELRVTILNMDMNPIMFTSLRN
jgi:hypothetical protein